ncbi:MAG: serine/threonine protein kinase [Gemmatimonadaceae bacterium]|nr:serine/threonine protein kinase [Gemmatimonadaceae bacterium]
MPARPTVNLAELSAQLQGRFTIGSTLRGGGQGIVIRATRNRDVAGAPAADDVALKLYDDAAQVVRIEREVAAMHQMRHPALANLVEHGIVVLGGRTMRFVACDFIEGRALDQRIRTTPPLGPKQVAVVGRDIANAIVQVWDARIVHRDINPKNIMLRVGDREAVLIDLGIARHTAQDTITSLGTAWGTWGYMSPEQSRADHHLSCMSDVFSLGIVLMEMLAGHHPTGGDQRGLNGGTVRTADCAPTASARFAALIDQMLMLRPAFRPEPGLLVEQFADLVDSH